MKLENRCMGDCCEDIGIGLSPDELKQCYFNFINNLTKHTDNIEMSEKKRDYRLFADIYLLYPMLRFVKSNFIHPESPKNKSEYMVYHYTCVHFNKKERKCDIYDIRPQMCVTYPNKSWCGNPKCKWDKMVNGRKDQEKEVINKTLISKKHKKIKELIDSKTENGH